MSWYDKPEDIRIRNLLTSIGHDVRNLIFSRGLKSDPRRVDSIGKSALEHISLKIPSQSIRYFLRSSLNVLHQYEMVERGQVNWGRDAWKYTSAGSEIGRHAAKFALKFSSNYGISLCEMLKETPYERYLILSGISAHNDKRLFQSDLTKLVSATNHSSVIKMTRELGDLGLLERESNPGRTWYDITSKGEEVLDKLFEPIVESARQKNASKISDASISPSEIEDILTLYFSLNRPGRRKV